MPPPSQLFEELGLERFSSTEANVDLTEFVEEDGLRDFLNVHFPLKWSARILEEHSSFNSLQQFLCGGCKLLAVDSEAGGEAGSAVGISDPFWLDPVQMDHGMDALFDHKPWAPFFSKFRGARGYHSRIDHSRVELQCANDPIRNAVLSIRRR